MSPHQLFVVLIRVLGLYVLVIVAASYFMDAVSSRFSGASSPDRNTVLLYLTYALSYTVVGLYLLLCAEPIAKFAENSRRSLIPEDTEALLPDTSEPTEQRPGDPTG